MNNELYLHDSMSNLQKAASLMTMIRINQWLKLDGIESDKARELILQAGELLKIDHTNRDHYRFSDEDDTLLFTTLKTLDKHQKYWLCVELYRVASSAGDIPRRTMEVVLLIASEFGIDEDEYLQIIKLAYSLE